MGPDDFGLVDPAERERRSIAADDARTELSQRMTDNPDDFATDPDPAEEARQYAESLSVAVAEVCELAGIDEYQGMREEIDALYNPAMKKEQVVFSSPDGKKKVEVRRTGDAGFYVDYE
jgi:hypothetical protein